MQYFINTYISTPLFDVLIFIYNNIAFRDLGLAIIILTVLVRIILLPFFYKGAKDQTLMQHLQPKIKEIQDRHRSDKTKQAEALMSLYREHKINPLSSILLLIIQIPIFVALFDLFSTKIKTYAFVSPTLFTLVDLTSKSVVLVLLAAVLQYFQTKLMMGRQTTGGGAAVRMQKAMLGIGPVITILILINLPSAIGLYWLIFTAFSFFQQIFINKAIAKATLTPPASAA